MTNQNNTSETSGEAALVSVAWQRRSRVRGTQQWGTWIENSGEWNSGEWYDHLEYETRALVTREQATETIQRLVAERECAEPDADEAAIDALRHKAFMSNSEADRQAYFDAVSKWFQDRHYRRMAHPDSSSDAEPVAWVDELGNFWLTEAVAKQYDAKPLYTHPDSSSEALRDALVRVRNFAELMMHGEVSYLNAILDTIRAALDAEVKK